MHKDNFIWISYCVCKGYFGFRCGTV